MVNVRLCANVTVPDLRVVVVVVVVVVVMVVVVVVVVIVVVDDDGSVQVVGGPMVNVRLCANVTEPDLRVVVVVVVVL